MKRYISCCLSGCFGYVVLLLIQQANTRILRTSCMSIANFTSYDRPSHKLVNADILKYNNKDRAECELACLLEPRCKSINSRGYECELNNKTISDPTDDCTTNETGQAAINSCVLKHDSKWTFSSTDYNIPRIGTNCNKNNPCGSDEYLCLDTCMCPGYQCNHCSTIDNYPCPDVNECLQANACYHGGVCENTIGSFVCKCPAGATGSRCEIDMVNDCGSNPCLNNGVCHEYLNKYACGCWPQYTGINCETAIPGGGK